jgi:hypothetical protein
MCTKISYTSDIFPQPSMRTKLLIIKCNSRSHQLSTWFQPCYKSHLVRLYSLKVQITGVKDLKYVLSLRTSKFYLHLTTSWENNQWSKYRSLSHGKVKFRILLWWWQEFINVLLSEADFQIKGSIPYIKTTRYDSTSIPPT